MRRCEPGRSAKEGVHAVIRACLCLRIGWEYMVCARTRIEDCTCCRTSCVCILCGWHYICVCSGDYLSLDPPRPTNSFTLSPLSPPSLPLPHPW